MELENLANYFSPSTLAAMLADLAESPSTADINEVHHILMNALVANCGLKQAQRYVVEAMN